MTAVSVIIVNWNGKHHLHTCLEAVRRQTFTDYEVILVDNGSTDGSVQYVRSCFPWVQLIALEKNLGFSGGNNAGIHQARGKYIALLNNDTEADTHWLAELVSGIERSENIGFCASRILFFDKRNVIDSAGDCYTTSGAARKRGHLESANECAKQEKVFGACGAAVLYRRSMLDTIGLFDEDFFLIYEDVDLSFRAQLYGFQCLYAPLAVVYHKVNASIGEYSHSYVYYGHRNLEYVFLKNMPTRILIKCLPMHLLYNVLALLFFTIKGRAYSFIRAKCSVIRALPGIVRKRREVLSRSNVPDHYIESIFTGSWLRQRWFEKVSCANRENVI